MGSSETVAALSSFEHRVAGSNAERRAALALTDQLGGPRREAAIETFWCRPNWALAQAWHVGLAVAGSLIAVASAPVGIGLIAIALVSIVLDALLGVSPGRRLSREHASQNVVSRSNVPRPALTLLITANYDAGRMGLAHRPALRKPAARLKRTLGGNVPGWLGWLALLCVWVLVTAILRDRGTNGTALGVLQLIPTGILVLALALLLELAGASAGPAANDNASGAAVAIALARALDAAPPRGMAVDVVLQGAGDGAMIGLSRYLRHDRRQIDAANTIVLGIAACAAGEPRWWTSDGPLVPMRFAATLQQLVSQGGAAKAHRGRGTSPAYPARVRGLGAITIGCLDGDGLAPRSHQPDDLADAADRGCMDRLLELALTLVDELDADLANRASGTATASPAAA